MAPQDIALAYYARQQRIVRLTANKVQAIWRRLDLRNVDATWQAVVAPGLLATVAAGQREAAGQADAYVATAAAVHRIDLDPAGSINATLFAGSASDGRPLKSLFYESVLEARWLLEEAEQAEIDAMMIGLDKLLRSAATQVADAGRTATGASITGSRTINGYIRVVNPPACSRCLILAGAEYGWNTGFQRHPRCDCVHLPAKLIKKGGRHPGALDSRSYFHSLSHAEQNKIFTASGAQAIRDGANPASVVNARRGMYTANAYGRNVRATRDSATRRGAWFRAERQRAIERGLVPRYGQGFHLMSPRLLPEEIYRLAGTRAEAIAMLRRFGYLT